MYACDIQMISDATGIPHSKWEAGIAGQQDSVSVHHMTHHLACPCEVMSHVMDEDKLTIL